MVRAAHFVIFFLCTATLAVAASAPLLHARCKRATPFPRVPSLQSACFAAGGGNCRACTSTPGCGFCGGAGCGTTQVNGCFNASERAEAVARGLDFCSHEGDLWTESAVDCVDECTSMTTCQACVSLTEPAWRARGWRCGWCGSGPCRVGDAQGFLAPNRCPGDYRFATPQFQKSEPLWRDALCSPSYEPCSGFQSCSECVRRWASPAVPCAFVVNVSQPVAQDGSGGGVCMERNQAPAHSEIPSQPNACPLYRGDDAQQTAPGRPAGLRLSPDVNSALLAVIVVGFLAALLLVATRLS